VTGHGPAHDLLMNAAAALLLGGGGFFIALSIRARRNGAVVDDPPVEPTEVGALVTMLAAALAVAGGAVHLAAAPSHIDELGAPGWGFVGATVFQASWALAWAISPTRPVAAWGIAGSLAIAVSWLWSRTMGLPFGPAAGAAEAVGFPDAAATLFEVLLVLLLAARVTDAEKRLRAAVPPVRSLPVIAAVPALGLLVVATSIAVTLALGHTHDADEGHTAEPAGIAGQPGH
jgi:hypothetical protein